MKIKIIVKGPQGSGKSTLIGYLSEAISVALASGRMPEELVDVKLVEKQTR